MPDQADMLRQLARAACAEGATAERLKLLLVVSAKGGVGTTTVAVQLATALAEMGRGSVLVDADLGRADATSLLGLSARAGLEELLQGHCGIEAVLTTTADGMQVLPAAWAPSAPCQPTASAARRLVAELRHVPAASGWIVADGGSSRSPLSDHLWQSAARVLMVTTPDDVAVMDTYARIKTLTAGGATTPIGILINRAAQSSLAWDVQARLEQSCRRFLGLTIDSCGQLPLLNALTSTEAHGAVLPSREPAVKREFVRLARRVVEATPIVTVMSGRAPGPASCELATKQEMELNCGNRLNR